MSRAKNKIILSILISLLTAVGVFFMSEGEHTVLADDVVVDRDMLSVKCQILSTTTSESESTNLRMVTALDSLNYKYVGFEVYIFSNDGVTKTENLGNSMTTVYETIIPSAESGVEYTFSPQIFGVNSKYFATFTIKNITKGLFDNGILVKPYVIATGDNTNTRIYGTNKYLTINDALCLQDEDKTNDYFRIPTIVGNGTYTVTDSSSVSYTVLEMSYDDGTYRHLKIAGNSNDLQSFTKFTVSNGSDSENTLYRNLYTKLDVNGDNVIDVDTSWYDPNATSHVIVNAAELYSFASMINAGTAKTTDTYYLAADIMVNDKGDANDVSGWATTAPTYAWTPIGNSTTAGKYFNGTFNGQNHTISGICQNDGAAITGLFGYTGTSTVIRNLLLKDSCFVNTKTSGTTYVGSIVGYGNGEFDTVYSNAFIYSQRENNGGLVGRIHDAESSFRNCQFAGQLNLTGNGKFGGGILGKAMKKTTITNCLNTGTIQASCSDAANLGGLCGYAHNVPIIVNDSVNVGTLSASNNYRKGTIIGQIYTGGSLVATNTYGASDTGTGISTEEGPVLCGLNSAGTMTGGTCISKAELSNAAGYWNTSLDFANYWQAVNGTLELRSFPSGAGEPEICYDTEWEGTGTSDDPYLISSTAELYGLAQQVNKDNTPQTYESKYFKLTSDITINKEEDQGKATTWGEEGNEPMFVWEPIGKNTVTNKDTFRNFRGNFDGNNKRISGVYVKTDVARRGVGLFGVTYSNTIQKIVLLNSYFESTASSVNAYVGSVVGVGQATTLQSVYSDATVVSSGNHNGGIMGRAINSAVSIYDCWFDGDLILVTDKGRYAGGILGTTSVNTILQDCLNSGELTGEHATSEDIGGLCGYNVSNTITIKRSLNVGTLHTSGEYGCGSVMGIVAGTTVFENVYVTSEQGWRKAIVANKYTNGSYSDSGVKICGLSDLYGTAASGLFAADDQDVHWIASDDALPRLACFIDLLTE